jgi:hypothetical protein
MRLNNPPADRQPHARAVRLCCKECFENAIGVVDNCIPSPSRFLPNAVSIASKIALSFKGLVRYAVPPRPNTLARKLSSGLAVIKTMGKLHFSQSSSCWSSGPDMPGIATSRIRHSVWRGPLDVRNSSADENVWTLNPNDFKNSDRDSRTSSSSSTKDKCLTKSTNFSDVTAVEFRLRRVSTRSLRYWGHPTALLYRPPHRRMS